LLLVVVKVAQEDQVVMPLALVVKVVLCHIEIIYL
jgi:hypothetical protein